MGDDAFFDGNDFSGFSEDPPFGHRFGVAVETHTGVLALVVVLDFQILVPEDWAFQLQNC